MVGGKQFSVTRNGGKGVLVGAGSSIRVLMGGWRVEMGVGGWKTSAGGLEMDVSRNGYWGVDNRVLVNLNGCWWLVSMKKPVEIQKKHT